MFSILQIARRLTRQRLISASIILGMALGVALGIAVPVTTDALASLGLRAMLAAIPTLGQQIQLVRQTAPFDAALQQHIRDQIGGLLVSDYTVSALPVQTGHGDTPLPTRSIRLRTQSNLADQIRITATAAPPQTAHACGSGPPVAPVPVMLSDNQIADSSFTLGEQLCVAERVPVFIAARFEARDPQALYWFGDQRPIIGERPSNPFSNELIIVLMLDREDFSAVAQRWFFAAPVDHFFRGFVREGAVGIANLGDVDDRLIALRQESTLLSPYPILVQTELDTTISAFRTRFQLLQSVLLALVLMLVILALVYLTLVGGLATQHQQVEAALLRSRGASRRQLMAAQISQSLVLALPSVVLGLGLGLLAQAALLRTPIFQQLAGGSEIGLTVRPATWLLPGLILLGAVLALALAARPALAHSAVTLDQQQARPPGRRRGVQWEALVLVLAALGVYQSLRLGGSLSMTPNGAMRLDLLVLLTPTVVLVAGSLLFLRLFPLLVRLLAVVLHRRRGLIAALSAWQLARDPLVYARLVLLLTLTIGLGIYSRAVIATITRSQARQALDIAGADIRVPLAPGDDPAALLATLPATASTLVSSIEAELLTQRGEATYQQGSIFLLGVDGLALDAVLARSGSDDAALSNALRRLTPGEFALGFPLPPNIEMLEVEVAGDLRQVTVVAKVAGSNGEREVVLGQPTTARQTLAGAFPGDLQPPFTLQSLIVAPGAGQSSTGGETIRFGQIAARVGGSRLVLERLSQIDVWDAFGSVAGEVRASGADGVLDLHTGVLPPGHWAALRFRVPSNILVDVIPAATGARSGMGDPILLRIGDQRLEGVVNQQIDHFPGVDPRQTILLTDRSRLGRLLTYGLPMPQGPTAIRAALPTILWPTELRAALEPGSTVPPIPDASTKTRQLLVQAADPLGNGVRVILLLGSGCACLLALLGFFTYGALMLQRRADEWTILHALGVSRPTMLGLIAAEHALVLGGSLLAGIGVGLLLLAATHPVLQVISPGDLPQGGIPWPTLLPLIGGLALALAIASLSLLLSVRRRAGLTINP